MAIPHKIQIDIATSYLINHGWDIISQAIIDDVPTVTADTPPEAATINAQNEATLNARIRLSVMGWQLRTYQEVENSARVTFTLSNPKK